MAFADAVSIFSGAISLTLKLTNLRRVRSSRSTYLVATLTSSSSKRGECDFCEESAPDLANKSCRIDETLNFEMEHNKRCGKHIVQAHERLRLLPLLDTNDRRLLRSRKRRLKNILPSGQTASSSSPGSCSLGEPAASSDGAPPKLPAPPT